MIAKEKQKEEKEEKRKKEKRKKERKNKNEPAETWKAVAYFLYYGAG